jgi:hypothetical protein
MKKITFILLLIQFTGLYSLMQAQSVNKSKPVLEVYYFHATHRCPTCISIEANTKKTLESNFSNDLKEGKIKFTVLNVDEEKNKTISQKYGAYGATLILVNYKDGKEINEDMTNFAFSYSRNQPEKFIQGLKDKINSLIQ